jgi:hypothetical protein
MNMDEQMDGWMDKIDEWMDETKKTVETGMETGNQSIHSR